VVEWPDFNGFGFNVHTLRDKPGQYIGKVDTGSPAAAAGLSHSRLLQCIIVIIVRSGSLTAPLDQFKVV